MHGVLLFHKVDASRRPLQNLLWRPQPQQLLQFLLPPLVLPTLLSPGRVCKRIMKIGRWGGEWEMAVVTGDLIDMMDYRLFHLTCSFIGRRTCVPPNLMANIAMHPPSPNYANMKQRCLPLA